MVIMGFYGIGVLCVVVVVVENSYDDFGLVWLCELLLYDVYFVVIGKDDVVFVEVMRIV